MEVRLPRPIKDGETLALRTTYQVDDAGAWREIAVEDVETDSSDSTPAHDADETP